jgi:hypothetical protein
MINEQGQTVAVGSSDSSAWVRTADQLPPNKVEVETKLDDSLLGVRNVQTLKRSGNLWFFPDMSMYVYYHPTHWRSLPNISDQPRGGQP